MPYTPSSMKMQSLMKQVQQMQAEAVKVQKEVEAREVTGSAGGGAVTIRLTGAHKVTGVEISPELIATGDAEMIADTVRAAMEEALAAVNEMMRREMGRVMGGMPAGMPNIF